MSKQPNKPKAAERKPGVIYETEDGQELMHHYFPEHFVVFNSMRVTVTEITFEFSGSISLAGLQEKMQYFEEGTQSTLANPVMKALPETTASLESQLKVENREN